MRTRPSGFNRLAIETAKAVLALVRNTVVPIFRRNERDEPEFEGTGVLVRLDGAPYLVSAAHVFDALAAGVYLLLDHDPRAGLTHTPKLSIAPAGRSRVSDILDIGVVALTEQEASAAGLQNFAVLTPRERVREDKWARECVLIGFPEKDQRPYIELSEYRLHRTYYIAPEVTESTYRKAGLSSDNNLCLEFNHRRISGPKGRGGKPRFKGISGGGIWEFDGRCSYSATDIPRITGILAGTSPRNGKTLFGASSDAIIEHIRGI